MNRFAPTPALPAHGDLHVERYSVTTPDGWVLELTRGVDPHRPAGPPVLFVPGFGMNSFIFRFHPSAPSFMAQLLARGLDPWAVDLRGSSSSRRRRGGPSVTLAGQAFADLPAVFEFITRTSGYDRVHAIGCSLGGALLYAYSATDHRIGRLVTMGTPLRWTAASPIVRAFARVAPASFPMRGTRTAARFALPVVSRVAPRALSLYLNTDITHIRPARVLSKTVEDPHPAINRELGRWIRDGDLHVGGVSVSDAVRALDRPLLVVVGGGDGICPPEAALAAVDLAGGPVSTIVVGRSEDGVGHADLFISRLAPRRVFRPVADHLLAN